MTKMELKHLVSKHLDDAETKSIVLMRKKKDFKGIDAAHRSIKISDIVSEDDQGVILIKSVHGVKLEKRSDEYVVTDNKRKRFYTYKSSTWAEKKYSRLTAVFARV